MRVTICELPHETGALAAAWTGLCAHTWQQESELVLLPEFAMVDPVWERESFDPARWTFAEQVSDGWMLLLRELHAEQVVGTRPVTVDGARYNEGFIWSAAARARPLRRKCYLPNEPGGWEARWFNRGDPVFPAFRAGPLSFGLNICTELWALETYAAYAEEGVHIVFSPRATAAATRAKWLAAGTVAAVRSGGFSVSSNRVDHTGAYGGAGWIISPSGDLLATTSAESPFATVDIDLEESVRARHHYPGYVFRRARC
jgi:N-carbamoylputrescine amidase